MSTKEIEETIKQLSNIKDKITELVKEYNLLAKDKNQNTRIAYATAESWANEEEDDVDELEEEDDSTDFYENKIKEINASKIEKPKRKTNYEKVVKESWGENVGISINANEAEYWFPSSICS